MKTSHVEFQNEYSSTNEMEYESAKCSKCNRVLPLDREHFHVRTNEPLQFRKDCKECVAKRGASYRKVNRDKVLESKRRYREKNLDKVREYTREYNARPEVKERIREYRKSDEQRAKQSVRNKRYSSKPSIKAKRVQKRVEQYHSDIEASRKSQCEYKRREEVKQRTREYYHRTKTPEKRLRASVKASIIYHLKCQGKSKNDSLIRHLGYTLEELKVHIESLWEPWMSWDNWGLYRVDTWDDNDPSTWTWHIDHIQRHHTFGYDSMKHPDFKRCWALSNLRPLSAKENVIRQ